MILAGLIQGTTKQQGRPIQVYRQFSTTSASQDCQVHDDNTGLRLQAFKRDVGLL